MREGRIDARVLCNHGAQRVRCSRTGAGVEEGQMTGQRQVHMNTGTKAQLVPRNVNLTRVSMKFEGSGLRGLT